MAAPGPNAARHHTIMTGNENSLDICIVLGGDGFIGRHIVESLLEHGFQVSVFDMCQTHDDVDYHLGDIRDERQLLSALKKSGANCIIHTVSPLSTKHLLDNPAIYHSVNVDGTNSVISVALAQNIRKLIYTSTSAVVFHGKDIINGDETLPYPLKHLDAYTESKALAEKLILDVNGKNGLMTIALRPGGVFGPRDRETVIGAYVAFKRGLTCIQLGDNSNLFDRTYVANVANAHVLAIKRLDNPVEICEAAGHTFFINDGQPVPFWDHMQDIWDIFYQMFPSTPKPRYTIVIPRAIALILANIVLFLSWMTCRKELTFTPHNVMFATTTMYFNNDKARRVLGYEPKFSIDEGMRRTAKVSQFQSLENSDATEGQSLLRKKIVSVNDATNHR
ncbi:3-beta hydroxysteroid dehydrogenase/isomerase family-domain-containing protein [Mycena sp. CBHHK59/15]|nr:3-beta hydroxysteroid dehydrogenase/isomerase family-domain-containing protein [Mycena sp. CBHHK59/15]